MLSRGTAPEARLTGGPKLRSALGTRKAIAAVAILSALLNILFLAGPLYMLLIYDSVMPSGSVPTLVGLLTIVTVIYFFLGIFEVLRARILSDVAAQFDRQLTGHVQDLIADAQLRGERDGGDGMTPQRDLDAIRNFLAGSGPGAILDLPWVLLFLGLLTLLHAWLGLTALAGALVLIAITLLNDRLSREPMQKVAQTLSQRTRLALDTQRQMEVVHALGMRGRMKQRWQHVNSTYLADQDALARVSGQLGGFSKVFRLFLQSLVLTVGALLYLRGEASGGIVFAASILAARALAPIDQAIANWRGLTAARQGWERLETHLRHSNVDEFSRLELPPPRRSLSVESLAIKAPAGSHVILRNATFKLEAGEALGVVGPSAAGKTSLVKALTGIWTPLSGEIRLDGAALDQWESHRLGAHLGYLPQQADLFEGTVAENIARFDPTASSHDIIDAAQAAAVHEMVLALPAGYDTSVGPEGLNLSAGQRQRIGLARALFGKPFLVVLDEPNSNLDLEGEHALGRAIVGLRKRGAITVLVAHRPSILSFMNKIAVLKGGAILDFGDRQAVLSKMGLVGRDKPEVDPRNAVTVRAAQSG
nr:type I secretion system permease/ATPase [Alteripontixanthobacter muriae]